MTNLSIFACSLLYLPGLLLAQGNYVANGSNNSNTAVYGTFNTFLGPYAGTSGQVTGNRNTVAGYNSGITLTSGSNNSFFGVDAGEYTTSGGLNTFLGRAAGLSNTTGNNNAFTGAYAGQANTGGVSNVFMGSNTGYFNTTGSANVFSGYQAGYFNTTGGYNVFTGTYAGFTNTTGVYNVFTGSYAGFSNTTGQHNVFAGYQAGYANTIGENNMFSGYKSGYTNTTGIANTFVGNQAGFFNTTGSSNTFTGSHSGYNNTLGVTNVFIGQGAGYYNTTGSNNTFMGDEAGYYNTTGNNNIIIGPKSGTAITTSDDNVLMGYNSQAEDGLYNAIAIGANSRVAASNAMILGNQVKVGIGTSAPKSKLEVVADDQDASGLRLSKLTSQSPASSATDQFLTVNQQGDVVKARYQLRINSPAEWSDQVFSPTYTLWSLAKVDGFIKQNGHLPNVPSANQIVKEGVDLVKINSLLLEKVEELTLYSIGQEKTNQQQQKQIEAQQHKIDRLEKIVQQLLDKN